MKLREITLGESSWSKINSFRDEWALLFSYGVFQWWRWCYGVGTVEGDERVIERSVCCMKKEKKKNKNKWVAGQESDDSCEMCGWGEWGRWGHTCGSLKYLTPPSPLFFLYSWIELRVTKGVGLALLVEGKWKEKKKKEKKRK